MLSALTSVYVRLKRPLVAGLLAPPTTDKVVEEGLLTYLEVIPTKRSLAKTYFPLGYKMKGDVAIAPILFKKEVVDAVNELRKRGSVLVVSEAKKSNEAYVFNGILLAFKTSFIGNLSWHVATGGYPPLEIKEEPLFISPPLLATLESVISGLGLFAYSFQMVPVQVKGKVELPLGAPLVLLGLATWRRERLASRKEGEGRGEASGKG